MDLALRHVHFPEDDEQLHRAIERLKFDELFTSSFPAWRSASIGSRPIGPAWPTIPTGSSERLLATVPFEPTKAQLRAIEEIAAAMAAPSR